MLDSILSHLTAAPWRDTIQYFDTITSTNDVLKELAAQGAPEGTTLVAGCQTGGRGRLGRTFLSPPETGIYMSVLLRPNCSPLELMHLTCAAGSAACDAIQAAAAIRPGVKWTNDIVYEKRKLAGILTEMGLGKDGSISYAIIGIGINCNQSPADFPPEIREVAGSLKMACGKPVDRALVAASMTDAFYEMNTRLLTQKEALLAGYRKDCITIGRQVQVIRGENRRRGLATGIDENGGLIVRYDSGETGVVYSGEVSVRGLYSYV